MDASPVDVVREPPSRSRAQGLPTEIVVGMGCQVGVSVVSNPATGVQVPSRDGVHVEDAKTLTVRGKGDLVRIESDSEINAMHQLAGRHVADKYLSLRVQ